MREHNYEHVIIVSDSYTSYLCQTFQRHISEHGDIKELEIINILLKATFILYTQYLNFISKDICFVLTTYLKYKCVDKLCFEYITQGNPVKKPQQRLQCRTDKRCILWIVLYKDKQVRKYIYLLKTLLASINIWWVTLEMNTEIMQVFTWTVHYYCPNWNVSTNLVTFLNTKI